MEFSRFGNRFRRHTGARELMDDLAAAAQREGPVMMLGGGNPAPIPEALAVFRRQFQAVLDSEDDFRRMVADYADPVGEQGFRAALAGLLRRDYGWAVGPENIALTGGSQNGFFALFNLLAGTREDGRRSRILLPLIPEYVGYADLGIEGDLFTARRPRIELKPDGLFKYRVDFGALADVGTEEEPVAALCASRPTNPTGNVLTDDEVERLRALARQMGVPLILDGAYGVPFPGIVFTRVTPVWDEDLIVCLSLSKLGLPGIRTGIVVARPEIIEALGAFNAVASLAVSSVGPVLLRDLVAGGELVRLSREVIGPFYRARCEQALDWLRESLAGCEFRVHQPEGAFFLWLWLPSLTIPSAELYRRLKERGVYVLSGHHFFPGLEEPWEHRDQCLRISYARSEEEVRRGLAILGEEVRRAHR
jgi:valine--pyruvate aminotransferase